MKMMTSKAGLILSTFIIGTVLVRAEPAPAPPAAPAARPAPPAAPFINLLPDAPKPDAPKPEAANAAGGKIQFEMPNYDFGKSKAGEPIKYTFVFTNIGTELLEIK